ncbi:MAG: hypothetical protein TREMPRED_001349 [Tremellales sp. Tagirdzhanova-0007]|nr:MAG: hypothetical protein TREMPRED_001349 [Tremellales sp. Tagirdzhanova-0007]
MVATASILFAVAGLLTSVSAAPAPVPIGGQGARYNDTPPLYQPFSDFDFQSLNLALNQEWIELDLFNYGVARFSAEEFAAAGLGPDDVSLINFMADQEVGHSTLLSNILQGAGAKRCEYQYSFDTVRDFVNFCQRLTRWGESGVYGFLTHLDSRPSATLLLQSIATEARQQMIFRQFAGAHPMPVYFETGISQAMSWSLLAPYIVSCPAENPHIDWQNFPFLSVTNEPDLLVDGYLANITHNRTSLSEPGRVVTFQWDSPGKPVSYTSQASSSSGSGTTSTNSTTAGSGSTGTNATMSGSGSTGTNTTTAGSGSTGTNATMSGSGSTGTNATMSGSGSTKTNATMSGSGSTGMNASVSSNSTMASNISTVVDATAMPLYNTSVGGLVNNTIPKYAAWISQLNTTYTLLNITGANTATTIQPGGVVYEGTTDGIVNGTMFIALTDTDLYVTPYNLSLLNDHIIAFGLYQAD